MNAERMFVLHERYVLGFPKPSPVGRWNIIIDEGFTWDGASIPRWVWSFAGIYPGGRMVGPSLVHDYLYQTALKKPHGDYTRKEADRLFRYLMRLAGFGRIKARRAYIAVRWFGRSHWKGA